MISSKIQVETIQKLGKKWGVEQNERIRRGVRQVSEFWRKQDGSAKSFQRFCLEHFLVRPEDLNALFNRFMERLETLYGHLNRVYREFNWPLQVDSGPILPADELFGSFDVYAHLSEDFFRSRLAFLALLNFPKYSLREKQTLGRDWNRRQWAEARLTDLFRERVPAEVNQKRTRAYTRADDYISNYNIPMDRLRDGENVPLFPEGMKLISHWGLRDELKAQYAEKDGFRRQKLIEKVMERVITQEIPAAVLSRREPLWNPLTNEIHPTRKQKAVKNLPEGGRRYQFLWEVFNAERAADRFTPDNPSHIERRFNVNREIAEEDVEKMLVEILTAPPLKQMADHLRKTLQRDLEAFDIWYTGFKPRSGYPEPELDRLVQKRFPNLSEFQRQIPEILRQLGFSVEKARFLADHIQVDPARGAGHALGARMRRDKAHLRTRAPEGGMNFKGFNTAMHELGHNVEQVFSLNGIDYYTLEGVPNTAFTEAFAFLFQGRDLQILELAEENPQKEALHALNSLWSAFEIAGVSLLDMRVWRWMYDHPGASAEKLREAVIDLARDVWNRYFAPVLGCRDKILLAIYSHIVYCGMYIPDYAIGHVISFQIESYLKGRNLGEEMERMCTLGRLAPQLWMRQAVGAPISPQAMISAAAAAGTFLNH